MLPMIGLVLVGATAISIASNGLPLQQAPLRPRACSDAEASTIVSPRPAAGLRGTVAGAGAACCSLLCSSAGIKQARGDHGV